jgi:hypothetical protein
LLVIHQAQHCAAKQRTEPRVINNKRNMAVPSQLQFPKEFNNQLGALFHPDNKLSRQQQLVDNEFCT